MTSKTDIPADLSKILFDNQAIVVVQPIADYRHCLYQSELALVSDVSEKRLLEFSTGRDCAHQALHKIGHETCPVLKGEQREPIWPEGVAGSISHCKDLAGAVVADKKQIHSVGFDIENRKMLNHDISRHICTPEEYIWISELPQDQKKLGLLLIFSLKEAVFKCMYSATQQRLTFKQCQIKPNIEHNKAEIYLYAKDMANQPIDLRLHYCATNTHIYSSALYRAA